MAGYLDALLGKLYADGEALELRGGLDFAGFDVTSVRDAQGRATAWRVRNPGGPATDGVQIGAHIEVVANPLNQCIQMVNCGGTLLAVSGNSTFLASIECGPPGVAEIVDGEIARFRDYGPKDSCAFFGAVYAGGKLWLTGYSTDALGGSGVGPFSDLVSCDPVTLEFTRWIHEAGATTPFGDIVASATDLYISRLGTDEIVRVSLAAPGTVAETLTIGGGATVYALAYDASTTHQANGLPRLWACDQANKKLVKINVTGSMSVGTQYTCTDFPRALAIIDQAGAGAVLVTTDASELWSHDMTGGGFAALSLAPVVLTDTFPAGSLVGVQCDSFPTRVWLSGFNASGYPVLMRLDVSGPTASSVVLASTAEDGPGTTFPFQRGAFLSSAYHVPRMRVLNGYPETERGDVYSVPLTGTLTATKATYPAPYAAWRM